MTILLIKTDEGYCMIQRHPARCVMADIEQQLLADIVQNITEESGAIEVVARVGRIADVPAVVADTTVDFLIMGMKSLSLPPLALSVMNNMPELPVIGLVEDGRRLAVYLDRVGKDDFLRIVRVLSRTAREQPL